MQRRALRIHNVGDRELAASPYQHIHGIGNKRNLPVTLAEDLHHQRVSALGSTSCLVGLAGILTVREGVKVQADVLFVVRHLRRSVCGECARQLRRQGALNERDWVPVGRPLGGLIELRVVALQKLLHKPPRLEVSRLFRYGGRLLRGKGKREQKCAYDEQVSAKPLHSKPREKVKEPTRSRGDESRATACI